MMARPRRTINMNPKGYAEVPLKKGFVALIDLEDVEKVSKYGWVLDDTKPNKYVHTSIRTKTSQLTMKLHRFILEAEKGTIVDHINGDGLDNRRNNLRLCTAQQSSANSKKSKRNSLKYKGLDKRENGKFRARIRVDGILLSLGTFESEEQAARAYNKAAIKYFGEFACLNLLP
jgi:hypothetical protein